MERKFRVLRFVASLYKAIAWIVLVLGIVGALGTIVVFAVGGGAISQDLGVFEGVLTGIVGGVLAGLAMLVFAVIQFIMLYAVGEGIFLFLALEQNTRETAHYLRGESSLAPPAHPF